MSEIDILVISIEDKFLTRSESLANIASSVVARLIKDVEGAGANPNEYKVLVAYQFLQPGLDLEKLFNAGENSLRNESKTISLNSLDIKAGHYLIFVKPSTVTTKLFLVINGREHQVKEQRYLVGREDKADKIFPDLDLTPYLGENERKISRSLIKFEEVDGKWKVSLDPKARTSVFVDGVQLRHGDGMDVGGTINIGDSPESPYLRIKTTIEGG